MAAAAMAKPEKKHNFHEISKIRDVERLITKWFGSSAVSFPWDSIRIFINLHDTVIINVGLLEILGDSIKPHFRGPPKNIRVHTPGKPDFLARYSTCDVDTVPIIQHLRKLGIQITFVTGRPESEKDNVLKLLAEFDLKEFAVICTGNLPKGPLVKRLFEQKSALTVIIDDQIESIESYVGPNAFTESEVLLVKYVPYELFVGYGTPTI
ncbi:MAG: hypothetical protein Harvfovirus25_4 [Harvfovirus sp.]|uniref:Uncharacterized protein n=1 Tax=Harvfovirus sp. TaxID=2487768 RepID=A0A3G5A263_9VIRU|nr:MAG: hypothetical protein Harvfovirus25_4 [Harvfovirus sp.]